MKTNHKKFKSFERVLVRVRMDAPLIWVCSFYSHLDNDGCHVTIGGQIYDDKDILPYEGNESLVGITYSPDDEVEVEEGEWVMVCDDIKDYSGEWQLRQFMYPQGNEAMIQSLRFAYGDVTGYKYFILFSNFRPNDMDETLKHVLCVKNDKIFKYSIQKPCS